MRYLITLAIGYTIPSLFNRPEVVYLALAIAAGLMLGLLVAMLTVGPSPRKGEPTAQPVRKPAPKRKPRRPNYQTQSGTDIYNYPQGAYA